MLVTVQDYGCHKDRRFKVFMKGAPDLYASGATKELAMARWEGRAYG